MYLSVLQGSVLKKTKVIYFEEKIIIAKNPFLNIVLKRMRRIKGVVR